MALILASVSALWFGILTSISPCPLATNIAAVSFIGKRVDSPLRTLLAGLFYAVGRSLVYVVLALLIVASALASPKVSMFLQEYMNKILGPVLILAGMFLIELIKLPMPDVGIGEKTQKRVEAMGLFGAALLGVLFALSLCPVSAALFFTSLSPLALKHKSCVLLPLIYGIGTALPVLVFALLLTISTRLVGVAFNKLTQFELWARRITGLIFISVGIYYALTYIFKVF